MDYEKMMELMKSISYKRKHGEPLNSEEMDFMIETYKSLCPLDYELMCFEFALFIAGILWVMWRVI